MQVAQPAYGREASQQTVLKIGPNQRYSGPARFCFRKNLIRTGGSSHDFDKSAAAHGSSQKLAVHQILVSHHETDGAVSTLWTGIPGHTTSRQNNSLKDLEP